jgi:predicted permease
MTLAALLLCGATVAVRTLIDLRAVDPGFEPERVLTLRVDLPRWRYETGSARRAALAGLLDELETLPGVEAVGAVNQAPLGRVSDSFRLWLPGRPELRPIDMPTAEIRTVAGGYLAALGIPLLRGRGLLGTLDAGGPQQALVNRPLAERLWPGQDPLGQRLSIDGAEGPWLEVVGVLATVRHFGVERAAPPELYVPYRQIQWPSVVLALRSSAPGSLVEPVLARLRAFDPELAAYEVATLDARLDQTLAPRRLPALVLSLFGVGGLLVAALGLYAMLAFGVVSRAREIGLRMAVGASRTDIARSFLAGGLRLTLLGLVLGLALGWGTQRVAVRWLDGLRALDLASVLFVVVVCLGVGVAAALGPAVRAARHDPARVLRS